MKPRSRSRLRCFGRDDANLEPSSVAHDQQLQLAADRLGTQQPMHVVEALDRAVADGATRSPPRRPAPAAGVPASDPTARIDERPAGVARIEGDSGLDDVVNETSGRAPE